MVEVVAMIMTIPLTITMLMVMIMTVTRILMMISTGVRFRAGHPHYFILVLAACSIFADRSAHAREARVRAGFALFFYRAAVPRYRSAAGHTIFFRVGRPHYFI